MIQRLKDLGWRALPLAALLVVTCLLSVFITASGAHWVQVLGDSGTVNTGTWADPNDCTYTMGYWKNHPEAWPVEEITIGGVTYTKVEAIAILETPPPGDATYILAHQLIPAKLNVARGADPSVIQMTIDAADEWLIAHPLGSNPADPDRAQGIALAETLDEYNNGVIGPGHCE